MLEVERIDNEEDGRQKFQRPSSSRLRGENDGEKENDAGDWVMGIPVRSR